MRKTDLVTYLQRHVLKLEPDGSVDATLSSHRTASGKSSRGGSTLSLEVAHHPVLPSRTRRVPLTK